MGKAAVPLLAAFALFLTYPMIAHPPDCPAEREAGDACRDIAVHAEHPDPWDCPREDGPERNACLVEERKNRGYHPAIWACEAEEEEWRDLCKLYARRNFHGICR